jgi:hypothetical protein
MRRPKTIRFPLMVSLTVALPMLMAAVGVGPNVQLGSVNAPIATAAAEFEIPQPRPAAAPAEIASLAGETAPAEAPEAAAAPVPETPAEAAAPRRIGSPPVPPRVNRAEPAETPSIRYYDFNRNRARMR